MDQQRPKVARMYVAVHRKTLIFYNFQLATMPRASRQTICLHPSTLTMLKAETSFDSPHKDRSGPGTASLLQQKSNAPLITELVKFLFVMRAS